MRICQNEESLFRQLAVKIDGLSFVKVKNLLGDRIENISFVKIKNLSIKINQEFSKIFEFKYIELSNSLRKLNRNPDWLPSEIWVFSEKVSQLSNLKIWSVKLSMKDLSKLRVCQPQNFLSLCLPLRWQNWEFLICQNLSAVKIVNLLSVKFDNLSWLEIQSLLTVKIKL